MCGFRKGALLAFFLVAIPAFAGQRYALTLDDAKLEYNLDDQGVGDVRLLREGKPPLPVFTGKIDVLAAGRGEELPAGWAQRLKVSRSRPGASAVLFGVSEQGMPAIVGVGARGNVFRFSTPWFNDLTPQYFEETFRGEAIGYLGAFREGSQRGPVLIQRPGGRPLILPDVPRAAWPPVGTGIDGVIQVNGRFVELESLKLIDRLPEVPALRPRRYFFPRRESYQPLSHRVTEPELRALLMQKAGEIPELKDAWDFARKEKSGELFLGGGLARGLLRWVAEKLQDHSLSEVQKTPPPNLSDLAIVPGADHDLMAPGLVEKSVREHLPKDLFWDFLNEDFYRGSVSAGGTSIEKLRLNPWKIEDPLMGLRAAYEGNLSFHFSPNIHPPYVRENSQLALALRYLRMSADLPFLRTNAGDLRGLERALGAEVAAGKLPPKDNRWVKKALVKLHASTGHDAKKTRALLDRLQLSRLLSEGGYPSPDPLNLPFAAQGELPKAFAPVPSLDEIREARSRFAQAESRELLRRGMESPDWKLRLQAAAGFLENETPDPRALELFREAGALHDPQVDAVLARIHFGMQTKRAYGNQACRLYFQHFGPPSRYQ